MSRNSFTPGPWFVDGDYDVATEDGTVVSWAAEGIFETGEINANSQLIAAAPELLEALQELFAHYKELADSGDAGNWKLEDEPVGKKAMAAIGKALGK